VEADDQLERFGTVDVDELARRVLVVGSSSRIASPKLRSGLEGVRRTM